MTWNEKNWLEKFNAENPNYRQLRKEVWENTKLIVENNGYDLTNGKHVSLRNEQNTRKSSSFYYRNFTPCFEPVKNDTEITVVPNDCLDTAHEWVKQGFSVSVLNLASRQNPGGGVINGAGAQEEYLFRCSDYYKFLYCYAQYAEEYGLERSYHQYPLDRNFGGIFSPDVTIFRENEKSGYKLAEYPWRVNMIAVAGMNSPRLEGNRIIPELVEGVKNKIRTIFRIACEQGQKNLVLGALGCGAFHNPPEHIAELFKEIIYEFPRAFNRICFAIKSDHRSSKGENYKAFVKIFG